MCPSLNPSSYLEMREKVARNVSLKISIAQIQTMKNSFLFVLLIIPFLAFSQEDEKVLLRWKLEPGEKLAFANFPESVEIDLFNSSRKGLSEEISATPDVLSKFIDNLRKMGEANLISTGFVYELSANSDTSMNFLMFQAKMKDQTNSFSELKKEATPAININGTLSTSGELFTEISPFQAKNAARFLFHLPEEEVSIGECWEFRGNFGRAAAGIEVDTLYSIDKVCLVDIEKKGTERIALIQYDISAAYRVESPFSRNEDEKEYDEAEISYLAEGRFSIDSGKWLSLTGLESISMKGRVSNSINIKSFFIELEP